MTTLRSTTDSFTDHSTDAGFRLWGSTISAHFAALGLVQSSDSGQINWATVTRPASSSTPAGYEIWKLNDSLSATHPIFIKIEYGNDNVANRPATWVSVGTATNGAGTLTGLVTGRLQVTNGNTPAAGTYTSIGCFVEGFLGIDFYRDAYGGTGVNSISLCKFCVSRTVDDSGTPTGDGFVWTYRVGTAVQATMQPINMASGIVGTASIIHTCVPGNFSSTLTDDSPGNYQAFKPYVLFPKMRPVFGLASTALAETARDTQYSATLIGTVPRNYICLGQSGYGNQQDSRNSSLSGINLGMLWE